MTYWWCQGQYALSAVSYITLSMQRYERTLYNLYPRVIMHHRCHGRARALKCAYGKLKPCAVQLESDNSCRSEASFMDEEEASNALSAEDTFLA